VISELEIHGFEEEKNTSGAGMKKDDDAVYDGAHIDPKL